MSSKLIRKSQDVGGPVGIAGRRQPPGKLAGLNTPVQKEDGYLQAKGYLDDTSTIMDSPRRSQARKSGGFLLEPAFNINQFDPTETYGSGQDDKGKGRADGTNSMSGKSAAASSSQKSSYGARTSYSRGPDAAILRHERHRAEAVPEFEDMNNAAMTDRSQHAKLQDDSASGIGDLKGPRKIRGSTEKAWNGTHAMASRQSGMDPTDIVNMALNLSESRRRHLSAGRLASMPISNGRRVASAGLQQSGLALQGSYRANESGNLLQQHLQKHIYSSRGVSPASERPHSYISNSSNVSTPLDRGSESLSTFDQPIGYGFNFSAGTIARAEKARKALELSIEFRRLLQFLPPLRQDSSAPINNLVTTASHPGSAHVEISRAPTTTDQDRPLGRAYNPLQLIRNRKVRARERRQFDLDVDAWDSLDTAKYWVDAIEEQSKRPDYRLQDCVVLPSPDPEEHKKASGDQQAGPSAKAKRSRLDWTISPCEAFADAHWLEQSDNKASIENRHGHKLFPDYKPPEVRNTAIDAELGHDAQPKHQNHEESASAASSIISQDIGEDTRGRAHRKRNFLRLPIADAHGKFKRRSWHRSPSRSSTSSNLSTSEHEDENGRVRPTIKVSTKDEETGPLARHMHTLMQSDNAGVRGVSPISPDHWDNQHTRRPISNRFDNHLDSSTTGDSASPREHRHWPTSKIFEFAKRPRRDLREESEPQARSSLDTLDSTTPNSPNPSNFIPSIGVDLSPPLSSGHASPSKHKMPKFHFFRSGDDKAKHNIESNDFAFPPKGLNGSRLSVDEARVPYRSSLEVPRPTRLRHVRSRTTDESSSFRGSKDSVTGKESNEHREPSSAVGRFFKGSLLGDRGTRLGDRARKKDSSTDSLKAPEGSIGASDVSTDTSGDEDEALHRKPKPRPFPTPYEASTTDDDGRIGRLGSKPRYHMTNLPSFKHSSAIEDKAHGDSAASQNEDPITSQQRALRKNNRSRRFEQLAPPKIDVSSVSRSSSPGLLRTETNTQEPDRNRLHERKSSFGSSTSRSRSPAADGGLRETLRNAGRIGFRQPHTGLSELPVAGPEASRQPSFSGNNLGKRHWSISDKPQEPQTFVNRREIARMEALFLSSGIKAKEITRQSLEVRPEQPDCLIKAAKMANTPLYPVARKEEHVLAARILSTHLEKTTKEIEGSVQRFRDSGVQNLRSELHEVRMRISDELTPLVLNKADEADAFTAELTSRHTLDIKQLNDYIELMKRQRWRRLRWVRRAGFTLLEWMLLGFMWWLWLVVILIKLVKTIIMAVVNSVRWILWL